MIDDLFQAGTDQALNDRVARAREPTKVEHSVGFWNFLSAGTLPRSIGAGVSTYGLAGYADVLGGVGQVWGAYPEALGVTHLTAEQEKQAFEARAKLKEGIDYSSPAGDIFRARGAELMPDPVTASFADNVLAGFGSTLSGLGLSALSSGPLAPLVFGTSAGLTEADKLKQAGVDLSTRTKAATVYGVGSGLLATVPIAAQTLRGTVGLVAGAGTANMAQIATEQRILQSAGYDKPASQYDPFDPWTVALGYGVPAVLGGAAMGVRAAIAPRAAKPAADVGRGPPPPGAAIPPPKTEAEMRQAAALSPAEQAKSDAFERSPGNLRELDAAIKREQNPANRAVLIAERERLATDAAVRADPELVDAVRVNQVARQVDSSRLTGDGDLAGMSVHTDAVQQAAEQLSNGERVDVSGIVREVNAAQLEAAVARMETSAPPSLPELFGDNLGYDRAGMPQVPARFKAEFFAELQAAGIATREETVPARTLRATQRDYKEGNIDFLRNEDRAGNWRDDATILVSRDNRVLDGHHRWAFKAQDDGLINVVRADASAVDLLGKARAFSQRKGIAPRRADEGIGETFAGLPEDQQPILRERYEIARRTKDDFDAEVASIAKEVGGEAVLAPLKSTARAVAKINGDYQGDATRISDLLRATIVADTAEGARLALATLVSKHQVLPRGWRNLLDPDAKPEADGYRDAKLLIDFKGGTAEIQIHTRAMLAAKKEGHALYVERSELEREARGGRFTPEQKARYDELNAQMRALYEPAWTDSTSARNSSSEIDAPLRRAESDENARVSDPSQAIDQAGSIPALNETGVPSTSQNSVPGSNLVGTGNDFTSSFYRGPEMPLGRSAVALTERGTEIPVRWALVEAGDLVTSHGNDLVKNPDYPAELQPRDRGRAASEQQIASIENAIKPQLLGESPKASDGAPIVGKDGVVESGNARTIALRRAYDSGKAEGYRTWLAANVEKVGIAPKELAGMKRPVLVRVGEEGAYDRAEFARQANESPLAAMSQTEQAAADAARLPSLEDLHANDDGTINVGQSAAFIRGFMQKAVSPAEQGSMMTATGELSQQGAKRIRDAVFARAYGDTDLVAMMAESTDANVKNVLAGMLRAAPRVAQLADLQAAGARPAGDITGPLVEAVRKFSQLRADGMTVDTFLAQRGMFEEGAMKPEAEQMLRALAADSRAPKRIAETITKMVDQVDELGDPRQFGMFGEAPSVADTLKRSAEQSAMQSRIDELMAENPDRPVRLPDGSETTLVEALQAVNDEHAAELQAADLATVAAECFLRAAE